MGANRRQGWALFVFVMGFTFLPAGLLSLGPLFTLLGLLCLIASTVMFIAVKPLEHGHGHSHAQPEALSVSAKKKQVV